MIGVVVVIAGFLTNGERTFANLLLMGYYMTGACLAASVFCAIQYVAQAGWSASIIRIPHAFIRMLPVCAIILLVIIAAGISLKHSTVIEEHTVVAPYLYKLWATVDLKDPKSPLYDAVIVGKSGFLNIGFFFIRLIIFLGAYSFLASLLVKYSRNEDEIGGMSNYKKSFNVACAFLAVFGFTSPIYSFDAIMSLEAHWFSTMFGWYNFAAMWVSGIAIMTLVIILMRQKGYLQWVTENHIHNLAMFMFGFSIFWTYLWFAQFLLQYYANIPEEVAYFYRRWEPQFKPWFWLNIVINFLTPFLVLMSRDSKRYAKVVKIACIILIVGHWLDYFMMIMPGAVGPQSSWLAEIGWIEIGVFIGFAGLFTFMIMTAISRITSFVPKNHPFLQESLHHHI